MLGASTRAEWHRAFSNIYLSLFGQAACSYMYAYYALIKDLLTRYTTVRTSEHISPSRAGASPNGEALDDFTHDPNEFA